MRKFKLLKTILIPSLSVLTIGSVATIVTSCGKQPPKPVGYYINGGSITLNGQPNRAGTDENKWSFFKDEQEITEGVTWEIVDHNVDDSDININNEGTVYWTENMTYGEYKFKVKATYTDSNSNETHEAISDVITLNIVDQYLLVGGNTILNGESGTAGEDNQSWILYKNDEPVSEHVSWGIVDPLEYVSINNGKVSWTANIPSGTYKFKVVATYEGQTFISDEITLTIIAAKYELSGGSLQLFGKYGTAGSDDEIWDFMKNGIVIPHENVSWGFNEAVHDGISITNGKVSWIATLPSGTYTFKITAEYDDQKLVSEDIILTINATYKILGGSTLLHGTWGQAGTDSNAWKYIIDDQEITEDVSWGFLDSVPEGLTITNGIVSWSQTVPSGAYTFQITGTHDGKRLISGEVVLEIGAVYSLSGGQTELEGKTGEPGSSEPDQKWVFNKDGEPLTSGVTWSIVEKQYESFISISDGIISWTSDALAGEYKFEVKGTYLEPGSTVTHEVTSSTITLTIQVVYEVSGTVKELEVNIGDSGVDTGNQWKLYEEGKEVTEGVTWSFVSVDDSLISSTISFNENNEIVWNNIEKGIYSFYIQATYNQETYKSTDFFKLEVTSQYLEIKGIIQSTFCAKRDTYPTYRKQEFYYSYDKKNWSFYNYDYINVWGEKIPIAKDQTIYLKGNHPEGWDYDKSNAYFQITGAVTLSGNIMSLLDNGAKAGEEGNINEIPNNGCFANLFENNTGINNVDDGFLPAIALKSYCYSKMFAGCTSLTKAPILSATDTGLYTCTSMFENCTSLTQAPLLLPTKLFLCCYSYMFDGCTSLTTALLPATNLGLGLSCYAYMFCDCSALSSIKIGYTGNISEAPRDAFENWVTGVANEGTFYYKGNDTLENFGFPEGWHIEHYWLESA